MALKKKRDIPIRYFEHEGSEENLANVLKILKRALRAREDLRCHKIVFFTAEGRGPYLAYGTLQEFDPTIIAVTFPPTFFVVRGEEKLYPKIQSKVRKFFDGVGIQVVTSRLPFDPIEGADQHNRDMKLIGDVLSLFSGSFSQCVQAVLQACDAGAVESGEDVIAVTGDCAAIITAANTINFLSQQNGMVVRELLCKPRTLNIARGRRPIGAPPQQESLLEGTQKTIEGKIPEKQLTGVKNEEGETSETKNSASG